MILLERKNIFFFNFTICFSDTLSVIILAVSYKMFGNTVELSDSNTDGWFTMAVSSSFLSPLKKIPLLQI